VWDGGAQGYGSLSLLVVLQVEFFVGVLGFGWRGKLSVSEGLVCVWGEGGVRVHGLSQA